MKTPGGGPTDNHELAQLPTFDAAVGGHPSILSVYTPFSAPAPIATLQSIADQGAVPLVAWGCDDTSKVSSGADDKVIEAYAQALKQFGRPVLLRWFWEMNLHIPKDMACIGTGGGPGFVRAWQRVWNIFHQLRATNVSLVWCPGIDSGLARMAQFFPGPQYTDWISADGYDRHHQGVDAFTDVFGPWYATYAQYNKPLIVSETGAFPRDQQAYLQGIATVLPTQYPLIKGLVYFDARGPAGPWQLVGEGINAFHELLDSPYFVHAPQR